MAPDPTGQMSSIQQDWGKGLGLPAEDPEHGPAESIRWKAVPWQKAGWCGDREVPAGPQVDSS